MPLSEVLARGRTRDEVTIEHLQSAADRAALVELAVYCEKYSPCVGLEEKEHPECLLLDITGISHLFGGEDAMAGCLYDDFLSQHFKVKIAVGSSIGMAWAAAHFLAQPSKPLLIPSEQYDLLWSLPVTGLRLGKMALKTLSQLGIKTIGQVFRLDRRSLPSRFGEEINIRWDQFTGKRSELIVPCRPTPKFVVERVFEDGVRYRGVLEHTVLVLLQELVALLQPRKWGVRWLQGRFVTEAKTKYDITIRLCKATADARQLDELLHLKLENVHFDAPLVRIRFEAMEICPLELLQGDFFNDRSQNDARQVASLLNRLSNRLGCQAVVRPRLMPESIPERAVMLVPVTEEIPAAISTYSKAFRPLDRPTCVFPWPRPVDVITVVPNGPPRALFLNGLQFEIIRHWGPERIETGWWQGPLVDRDYYRLEIVDGRRFWLFRRLSDQRWFMHGAFF